MTARAAWIPTAPTLTINNLDPIADVDGPYAINEGQDLVLDSSGSSEPGRG